MGGYIAVDLDATLAQHDGWKGPDHIEEPVLAMLERVKGWLDEGRTVKIFTARASRPEQIPSIKKWLQKHGIGGLEITNIKDFAMQVLYDDRAIQVEPNTGRLIGVKEE